MGCISPIISFPKLKELSLRGLPKLVSLYRGVLISSSLPNIIIEDCPKLKRLPLLESVICDESPATLASIPTYINAPQRWEALHQQYPQDAIKLSYFINRAQTPDAKQHDGLAEQDLVCRFSDDQSLQFEHFSDEQRPHQDRKRKRELGSCLSLSLPSNIPDYDEETHGQGEVSNHTCSCCSSIVHDQVCSVRDQMYQQAFPKQCPSGFGGDALPAARKQ